MKLNLFGGYKNLYLNILPSVAQIILAVFFLPVLCFILSLLSGADKAFSMITNLISEFSVTEYWFDLITLLGGSVSDITNMDILTESFKYVNAAVLETCAVGMCVGLCKNVGVLLDIRGIPVMQSILGVFLGCIVIRYCEISNEISSLFYCVFLIVLNIVVIWLLPSVDFIKKLLDMMTLGLQMIIAALAAGYIVFLASIMNGTITSLKAAISVMILLFLPMLLVLAVDYFALTPTKKKIIG